jgi:chemotaxis protein MotB
VSRPKKHSEESHEEGASTERWLLTYADMITLLMVLFIVLFAMGQTDIRKFNAFKDSFHQLQQQSQANAPPGGPGILSQPSAIALSEQNPYAKLDSSSATSASGKQKTAKSLLVRRPTASPIPARTSRPTTSRSQCRSCRTRPSAVFRRRPRRPRK